MSANFFPNPILPTRFAELIHATNLVAICGFAKTVKIKKHHTVRHHHSVQRSSKQGSQGHCGTCLNAQVVQRPQWRAKSTGYTCKHRAKADCFLVNVPGVDNINKQEATFTSVANSRLQQPSCHLFSKQLDVHEASVNPHQWLLDFGENEI